MATSDEKKTMDSVLAEIYEAAKKGTTVAITSSNEPWSEYTLDDGTKLKAKMVLIGVKRLDEKDVHGNNKYVFQFSPVMHAEPKPQEDQKND